MTPDQSTRVLGLIVRAERALTNAGVAVQTFPEAERAQSVSQWLVEADTQIAAIRQTLAQILATRRAA